MPHRSSGKPLREDFDSPWKEALERFLPQSLAIFAPELHDRVDWSQPPVFLDKEFQGIAPGVRHRRQVDKLARLKLACGRYVALLLHVEVESRHPSVAMRRLASLRLQQYDYRIHDRYVLQPGMQSIEPPSTTVYSLVIFTRGASGPDWLTAEHQALQNAQPLRYQAVYLGRWLARWRDLETLAQANPFAMVIMAQLLAHRHPRADRLSCKVGLVRKLIAKGYAPEESISLLRLIDWLLALPAAQQESYARMLVQIEQESRMAFVMTHERVFTKQGIAIGLKRGQAALLQDMIEQKFGPSPDWVGQRLDQADPEQLRALGRRILIAESLQGLFGDAAV